MMISSGGAMMDALRQLDLLTPDQLAQLPNLAQGRCGNARQLAKALLHRDWLTVFQVNQLLVGHGDNLVIGPYQVLDRLGQGGLSAVYKAKHREYEDLVAIKIIKPEVFACQEGRAQFLQEVEAMARFDHPNIVQFCDADQWRDTFYFAMEYVEGTDLGKVIRLSGAMPVAAAADYIRQTALGLQHAFERNLIHRDIKPVNLFLTQISDAPNLKSIFATASEPAAPKNSMQKTMCVRSLIKILDWGLASLRVPKGPANQLSEAAAAGIIGTADYISPEQACNANAVDIRGDIYSLGCSFYFLLTGQAPFPEGTLMQKVLQHQHAEPKPIESFREDVPPEVISIVKRMMAKKPEDRFQTPASVALALMPFTRRTVMPAMTSSTLIQPRPKHRDDTPIPPTLSVHQRTVAKSR